MNYDHTTSDYLCYHGVDAVKVILERQITGSMAWYDPQSGRNVIRLVLFFFFLASFNLPFRERHNFIRFS